MGHDEVSKKTATTVDSVTVSSKLETQDFVAIKVESNSETYCQFVQIYQLVPVPSLFFIGGNGIPLEVIAGDVDEGELVRRIDSVLEKCKGKPKEVTDGLPVPTAPEASSVSQNEVTVAAPSTSEDKTSDEQSSTADALNTEQKIERAKELIETKRKMKEEEEKQLIKKNRLAKPLEALMNSKFPEKHSGK